MNNTIANQECNHRQTAQARTNNTTTKTIQLRMSVHSCVVHSRLRTSFAVALFVQGCAVRSQLHCLFTVQPPGLCCSFAAPPLLTSKPTRSETSRPMSASFLGHPNTCHSFQHRLNVRSNDQSIVRSNFRSNVPLNILCSNV